MTESLDQVLTDMREQASVLRYHGHNAEARVLEDFADKVSQSASEYLTWLTENEASLYSARSADWLRSRFAGWERRGLAKLDGRRRMYRRIALEHRGNAEAARAAGERAGRGAA